MHLTRAPEELAASRLEPLTRGAATRNRDTRRGPSDVREGASSGLAIGPIVAVGSRLVEHLQVERWSTPRRRDSKHHSMSSLACNT